MTEIYERVSKVFGPRFEALSGSRGPSKMNAFSLGSRKPGVYILAEMGEGLAKAEVAASQQMSAGRLMVSPRCQDSGMDLGIGFWSHIGKRAGEYSLVLVDSVGSSTP